MPPQHVDELVDAWLTYQRNWWSHAALTELCSEKPDVAWVVLLKILARADDDAMLQTIGAGPLEDLLRGHASVLVERVEAEAVVNPKLLAALTSVWLPRSEDPVTTRLVTIGCDMVREMPDHMHLPIAMFKEAVRLAEQGHKESDDA